MAGATPQSDRDAKSSEFRFIDTDCEGDESYDRTEDQAIRTRTYRYLGSQERMLLRKGASTQILQDVHAKELQLRV